MDACQERCIDIHAVVAQALQDSNATSWLVMIANAQTLHNSESNLSGCLVSSQNWMQICMIMSVFLSFYTIEATKKPPTSFSCHRDKT